MFLIKSASKYKLCDIAGVQQLQTSDGDGPWRPALFHGHVRRGGQRRRRCHGRRGCRAAATPPPAAASPAATPALRVSGGLHGLGRRNESHFRISRRQR